MATVVFKIITCLYNYYAKCRWVWGIGSRLFDVDCLSMTANYDVFTYSILQARLKQNYLVYSIPTWSSSDCSKALAINEPAEVEPCPGILLSSSLVLRASGSVL